MAGSIPKDKSPTNGNETSTDKNTNNQLLKLLSAKRYPNWNSNKSSGGKQPVTAESYE